LILPPPGRTPAAPHSAPRRPRPDLRRFPCVAGESGGEGGAPGAAGASDAAKISCGLWTPGGPPAYGAWEFHADPPLQSRRSTALARNTRRRPKQRATLAAFALILGGGGMMAANVYASATEDGGDTAQVFSGATIDCPDV